MGRYSFLRPFAGPDGALPTARQLYEAFALFGSDFCYEGETEGTLEYLADFTRRWGKPSPDNLLAIAHRFAPGQPRSAADEAEANSVTLDDLALGGPDTIEEADATFALAALGIMRPPEAPAALVPYLTSPYALERWLAAFGLVALHDERALSALGRMLVEFIGPNQPASRHSAAGYYIQTLRSYLPQMLAEWGDPRLAPLLRTALIATVRAEEIEVPDLPEVDPGFVWNGRHYTGPGVERSFYGFYSKQLEWVNEEHQLVYTLGRMGAFGALEGVPTRRGVYSRQMALTSVNGGENYFEPCLPESHAETFRANVWRVHMCFGALESRFCGRMETAFDFSGAPELAEAVEQLLAGKFGMDEAARRRAMEDYDKASWTYWTIIMYGWGAERVREVYEDE